MNSSHFRNGIQTDSYFKGNMSEKVAGITEGLRTKRLFNSELINQPSKISDNGNARNA